MRVEIVVALLSLGGVTLMAVGALVGAWLARRSSQEATEASVHAHQKTAEHQMIDQLQEELNVYRAEAQQHALAADERATAQDARMNRLELYSDGYRSHAHELRSWIWDGKPPPPPPWPEGLPK